MALPYLSASTVNHQFHHHKRLSLNDEVFSLKILSGPDGISGQALECQNINLFHLQYREYLFFNVAGRLKLIPLDLF